MWAPDEPTAARVRNLTGGDPAYRRRGEPLPLVTNVGIGVDAYDACQTLAEAGFDFTWHESQHPLNREGGWPAELPGMPQRPT